MINFQPSRMQAASVA